MLVTDKPGFIVTIPKAGAYLIRHAGRPQRSFTLIALGRWLRSRAGSFRVRSIRTWLVQEHIYYQPTGQFYVYSLQVMLFQRCLDWRTLRKF